MITDNDQYVMVDGHARDEKHPHGDLDRIIHDGKLLPVRPGAPVLFGQDIAWMVECIKARMFLSDEETIVNKIAFLNVYRNAPRTVPKILPLSDMVKEWNTLFDKRNIFYKDNTVENTVHRVVSFEDEFKEILWGNGQEDWKLDVPKNDVLLKRDDVETMIKSFQEAFIRCYCHCYLISSDEQKDESFLWVQLQGDSKKESSDGKADDLYWYQIERLYSSWHSYYGEWAYGEYERVYRSNAKILIHIPEIIIRIIQSFRLVCNINVSYSYSDGDEKHGDDSGLSLVVSKPVYVTDGINDYIVQMNFDDGITSEYGIDRSLKPSIKPPEEGRTWFYRSVYIGMYQGVNIIMDLKDSHTKYK